MEQIKQEYKNKRILVVGLGIQGSGVGVAKFFAELGSHVTVTDLKNEEQLSESIEKLKTFNIDYVLARHDLNDFVNADIIFKNPAVRWDTTEIQAALDKNIPVEMEASFFASYCPAKIIGITGTRGKSTTSQMIYEMMKTLKYNVFLAGNVRNTSTIELLKTVTQDDWVVLELSSWQLSGFHRRKISPHISVFTNFYPDHLNYYSSMEDYYYDKAAIYMYQKPGDWLIANESLEERLKDLKTHPMFFDEKTFPRELQIPGVHNTLNAGAALQVARILEIEDHIAIPTIAQFKGLPFRMQMMGIKQGRTIINDTTSTTPVATETALETLKDQKVVLILGGNAKNLPYDTLLQKMSLPKKIVLLKGTFTDEIISQLPQDKLSGVVHDNLKTALEEAFDVSDEDDTILFSPGATSFAQFKNEFDRGEQFNALVETF